MVFGLIGGAIAGIASLSGANKQAKSADAATALQRDIYEENIERLTPFYNAGSQTALPAYLFELGLGDRPEGYEGISLSPGAQFALEEGRDTLEAGAAGRGGLFSGSTAKGLERFRYGLTQQDRDNQLNRMLGLAQMGQNAATAQGAQGTQFAQSAGNNMMSAANAQSAGLIGASNAINRGIDSYYMYQGQNNRMFG